MRGKMMSVQNDLKKECVLQCDHQSRLTFADLKRTHQEKLKATNKNRQQIRNQMSSLSSFMKYLGRSDEDLMGDDFGPHFQNKLCGYTRFYKSEGLAQSTLTNSVSHLRKIEKTAQEMMGEERLPESFPDALGILVERSGLSQKALSEFIGLEHSILHSWIHGTHGPSEKNKRFIPALEKLFGVTEGLLQKRLCPNVYGLMKRMKTGTTEYGKKVQELSKDHYKYNHPRGEIKAEWLHLLNFYTVPFFLDNKDRNSKWRVKSKKLSSDNRDKWFTQAQGGVCAVAAMRWQMVSSFLGFLILPKDRGGEERGESELSLALLSDADLVVKYINFRRNRSGCFTGETRVFLEFCLTLLRKKTGYLRQFSEMGKRLLNPISREEWEEYCEKNWNKISKILRELKKGKEIKKGRNPDEPIKAVLENQNPIDVLWKMIETMEKEQGQIVSEKRRAKHIRDIVLIKMLTINPLRRHHYSIMTYKDNNTGNLVRFSDGSWGLHFEAEDFKNQNGAAHGPYDVLLSQSIWKQLEEYIREYRRFLIGADKCDYLFLSGRAFIGDGMWLPDSISARVKVLTQRYIPNCPGFGTHAFRHIVATEYLKNNPNGYQVVANILHDKLETVLSEYAHLKTADGFSHWISYLDRRIEKSEGGNRNE
jgi:integrase